MMKQAIVITLDDLKSAYTLWVTEARNPEMGYATAEETEQIPIEELAEINATQLWDFLHQDANEQDAEQPEQPEPKQDPEHHPV